MASKAVLAALGFPLTAGVYVLCEDVKNPRADRRVKHQFDCIPVWKKGMKLTVRTYDPDDVAVGVVARFERQFPTISCEEPGIVGQLKVYEDNKDAWQPLVARMVPAPQNLGTALAELNRQAWVSDPAALLARFMETRKITYEDVLDAGEFLASYGDEAHEEWRKDHGI